MYLEWLVLVVVSKKTEKSIKSRKLEKKQTVKKNRLEFLKNRPVRFYKPETKKTEPSQTGKNRAKPEPVSLNMFHSGFFLKKNRFDYFFL